MNFTVNPQKAPTPGAQAGVHEGGKHKGPKRSPQSSDYTSLSEKLYDLKATLSTLFPGREEQAEVVVVGLATGLPVFLMSPPGTAKTAMIDTLSKLVSGARYFYYLLSQYTEPDELLGPVDIRALREGIYKRNTQGKLPEAHIVFLDEIFKASSAIRNTLLDIILNKRVPNGNGYINIPLKALYTASNEISDDEEDQAIYDRFVLRSFFDYVSEDVLEKVIEVGVVFSNKPLESIIAKPVLTLEDVDKIQEIVKSRAITIAKNAKIRKTVVKVVAIMRQEGIEYSDRRVVQLFRVLAGLSMARKKFEPSPIEIGDAFLLTAPMTPEHIPDIEEVLQKSGLYASKEILEKLEQLVKEAENLLAQYRQERKVDQLIAIGDVVKEINKVIQGATRLPKSLVKRIENIIDQYNKEVEELQKIRNT